MRIGRIWSVLRAPLSAFTFYNIKKIASESGLEVNQLGHVQQRSNGASKGQLIDALDGLFNKNCADDQDRIVVSMIREMIRCQDPDRRKEFVDLLSESLSHVGWALNEDEYEPYPLSLQIYTQAASLDEEIKSALSKCTRRFRDGDISGALTAICGAVDKLTLRSLAVNLTPSDIHKIPYAKRVKDGLQTYETLFKRQLLDTNLESRRVDQMWHHLSKSVEQAGEVLAYFRPLSDVHGEPENFPTPTVVQHAISCALYITEIFLSLQPK